MPLNRRRAREVALQVLYADDLNPQRDLTEADEFLCRRLRDVDPLVVFARGLVSGVRRCRGEIDASLGKQASNWSLDRMAAIDRNLLRLGAYEILHTETPPPVVLNEVIELAKRFGGRQSHQFVNGILDKLVPPHRASASRRHQGNGGGTAIAAKGAASRGNSSGSIVTRNGVVSRYGLTVRPRVKNAAAADSASDASAPPTAGPGGGAGNGQPMAERGQRENDGKGSADGVV